MKTWFGILLAGLIACQSTRNPYSNPDITKEEIGYHIRILASDSLKGRFPGTPEIEMAADYLASEFKHYGLEPMGVQSTYFQPFEVVSELLPGTRNELKTSDKTWTIGTDFLPLNCAADTAASAPVVFVGYGISAPELNYDDYAGLDVQGKIVLMLRYTPAGDSPHSAFYRFAPVRRKVSLAAEKGALGVLIMTGPLDGEDALIPLRHDNSISDYGIPGMTVSREVGRVLLGIQDEQLNALQQKINGSRRPASLATATTVSMASSVLADRKITRNVIAFLEGSHVELNHEVIVLGAHYDHLGMGGENSMYRGAPAIHNGADDNASGTSALLELAQRLASHRDTLQRSVLFIAFSGEEMGTLGSKYFLEHPTVDSARMIAMFNFDMVGRMKEDKLVIHGVGTSPPFESYLKQANENYQLKLTLLQDGNGPSDFAEFYRRNIPVIGFFTDVHEDYHKPTDDADKINVDGEEKIVRLALDMIMRLSSDQARPGFVRVKSTDSSRTPTGFRATLGIVPGYASAEEGLKVDDVNPGQAADKAGIKKGDLIIRFGPKTIKNVYDYTYALGDYKPGDEVEVVVRREGKELTLKAILQKSRRM